MIRQNPKNRKEQPMASIARVSEISARAGKTLRKIESAWVKEVKVEVKKNKVAS